MADPTIRSDAQHSLRVANDLVANLETALCEWTSAVANFRSVTGESTYHGLAILGRMSPDRADAIDSYTERERLAANTVVSIVHELAMWALGNPSHVRLIRAHAEVLMLSARWSGKSFGTLYGYLRRTNGPVNRVRKGGRPVPVAPRHNYEQCYGVPCVICEQCPNCQGHAATCHLG
jgi:hypothetical protein